MRPLFLLLISLACGSAAAQSTLDIVRSRGVVQCGVNTGLAGFAQPDSKGVWRGIDVDVCRAVAAAVFGDATKVRYTPLTAQQRFTALQSGEVDILSRNTTWTITRDTSLGLNFVGTNYYDGQGFMVPKKLNVKSAKQLNGATVCVQPGTTTELNLADYFRANRMSFRPVVIEKLEEVLNAYFAGRCDVFTTDHSGLIALRGSRAPNPADHVILPEIISKEPLGPTVRHGDHQFADIVRWALFAQIEAEEYGISRTVFHSGRLSRYEALPAAYQEMLAGCERLRSRGRLGDPADTCSTDPVGLLASTGIRPDATSPSPSWATPSRLSLRRTAIRGVEGSRGIQ